MDDMTALDRRALLRAGALAGPLATLGRNAAAARRAAGATAPWYDLGMPDGVTDSQLLHVLGQTYAGQADIGEVLDTATRISADDEWSWPTQWSRTAERLEKMAERSARDGRSVSAGKAWLRAATYHRAALLHHPDPKDTSNLIGARRAMRAYGRGIDALRLPYERVAIPYQGVALPGFLARSPHARRRAPLIVLQQGRDAWPESSGHLVADALARGYHMLLVHTPGQGLALRELGLAFRPDWEAVIGPILDHVERMDGIDRDRVALFGWSMGGALAPRAAAFDRRIRLLVANPGVLDWGASTFEQFAAYFPDLLPLLDSDPDRFDREILRLMERLPLIRWYMRDAMAKHGVDRPSALLRELRRFTNADSVHRIRARTLVVDGTGESTSVGQARKLFDALRCDKDFLLFDAEDTGLLHCQEGASAVSSHRIFDWVDRHI